MNKLNYYEKIKDLLEKLPKNLCVAFAIYCAKDQLHKITDKDEYSKCLKSLDITEKYMKGLASKSELESAANASYPSYYAANAAYYAANAAYYAANAVPKAVYQSSAYAVAAAEHAANAAVNARVDKEIKLKEYYEVLLSMIDKLPKLEKLVYKI